MIGLGRYNLLLKLGQGGMGAVFLARQKTLRRFCAIKVISPQFAQDQAAADRFLREARATASLTHPNLVSVFDCDKFDGQYFIAMEYVEGMSLGEIIRSQGALPLPLALNWLNQAIGGLEYIHNKGVVHRDVKPDNMIVDSSGILKVMDLGLAKEHFEGDQSMTMTGMVMGSPQYMSPEQINDSKTVDHRTDLYSLGISFYQMLVGKVPFPQTSAAAVCVAHLQQAIPSVELPDTDLTQALDSFIFKMTAKNKDERFQSATELSEAIAPWVANNPPDQACQDFLNQINFDLRKVSYLLEQEGINPLLVDSNYDSPSAQREPQADNISPSPSPTWVTYLKGIAKGVAFGVLALAVVLTGAKILLKGKKKPLSQETPKTAPSQHANASSSAAPAQATVIATAPSVIKTGGLYIATQPENASVRFQSESKQSPATFNNVPIGKYSIKISSPGYEEIQKGDIEIFDGKFTELDFALKKIPGYITIESNPPKAEVIVSGQLVGRTPYRLEGRDGEVLECRLRLEGYEDAVLKNIQLKKDGEKQKIVLAAMPKPKIPDMAQSDGKLPPLGHEKDNFDGEKPWMKPKDPQMQEGFREPMGGGGMEGRDGFSQKIKDMLEVARMIPDDKWDAGKKMMMDEWRTKMKEKKMLNQDAIDKTIGTIEKIAEKARELSPEEFDKRKDIFVEEVMQTVMRAMGPPMKEGEGMMPGRKPKRFQ